MSIYKSKQKRHWISFLILVQLIAMLLPVHVVSAADQQIVIPKEAVDAMIFQVLWQQRVLNEADAEADEPTAATLGALGGNKRPKPKVQARLTVEAAIFNELILQGAHPDIMEIELWDRYKKAIGPDEQGNDFYYRLKKTPQEIMFVMLDVAKGIPELRPFVKPTWETLSKYSVGRNSKSFLMHLHLSTSAKNYGKAQALLERAPKVLQQVIKSAQENPQAAIEFDILYGEEMGVSIKDFDAYDYITEHPDDIIPPVITRVLSEPILSSVPSPATAFIQPFKDSLPVMLNCQ